MAKPLTRTRKADGSVYTRPTEIEAAIDALSSLTRTEIRDRLQVRDRTSPDHLPSEFLIHLIRQTRLDNDPAFFEALYRTVLARIDAVLPRPERRISTSDFETDLGRERVRSAVVDRFNELLAADRAGLSDALDIYECRFDYAIARRRGSARHAAGVEASRSHPHPIEELIGENDDGEPASAALISHFSTDPTSRMRMRAMIDTLPATDRRIIDMLIAGYLIDSNKADEVSIRGVLGCDEKTVRNRRDAFVAAMRRLVDAERSR